MTFTLPFASSLLKRNFYTATSQSRPVSSEQKSREETEKSDRSVHSSLARSYDWPVRSKGIDDFCTGTPTRPTYTDLPASRSYQHSLTTVVRSIRYHIMINCYSPRVVLCPLEGARWTWCSDYQSPLSGTQPRPRSLSGNRPRRVCRK